MKKKKPVFPIAETEMTHLKKRIDETESLINWLKKNKSKLTKIINNDNLKGKE
jgi:hypothetical protein